MIKESFILFNDFRESFNELSNEEAGILIKAIFDYTATGIEPKLDKLLKLVFIPIKQCIDRNSQNYETIKNARSEAGKKGMEKRWKNKENNNDNKNNKNDFVIQDSNINNQEDIEDNNKITNYNKNNKAILLYNNDNKNNLYVNVNDDVNVNVDDSVLLSPLTPQGGTAGLRFSQPGTSHCLYWKPDPGQRAAAGGHWLAGHAACQQEEVDWAGVNPDF